MLKSALSTLVVLFLVLPVFGQYTLSISSGLSAKGGTFGYQINEKLNAYLGLNYIKGSANLSESFSERENGVLIFMDDDNIEFEARIFIPTLGVKYFILEKNKVKLYGNANVSFPMLSAQLIEDGDIEEELEGLSNESSSFGYELGLGGEYFFDSNFSIGGEIGFQKLSLSSSGEDSYSFQGGGPNNPVISGEEIYTADFNLSTIYSRFTMNFYF